MEVSVLVVCSVLVIGAAALWAMGSRKTVAVAPGLANGCRIDCGSEYTKAVIRNAFDNVYGATAFAGGSYVMGEIRSSVSEPALSNAACTVGFTMMPAPSASGAASATRQTFGLAAHTECQYVVVSMAEPVAPLPSK